MKRVSKRIRCGCVTRSLLLATMMLGGCGQPEIRVYRIPKEKPALASSAAHDHATQTLPKLEWQLPPGWEEQGPGRMTVASFRVPGKEGQAAEVSVMPMQGERDLGLLVNIVRRGSELKPLSNEELSKMTEEIRIGETSASLVDLTDAAGSDAKAQGGRILLTVLSRSGMTWLFKMAGSAEVVSAQKEVFLGFLKSIKFQEAPDQTAVASSSSTSAPPASDSGAPGETKPQWEVPAGWREVPATQMVVAKFLLTGPGESKAEVSVSVFPGAVGGVLANVNRWRNQLSLPAVADAELPKVITSIDVAGGKATLVDMNGKDPRSGGKARLIGVILPQGGRTWFYKLTGDEAVAEQEKAAFLKFVQTAKHPDAA
ncbi:MAG: hypothetical protein HY735_32555 [Verrucomicrobia bacterium]|nr:hypothetical protein [Verrucomicrobiota bacterium]